MSDPPPGQVRRGPGEPVRSFQADAVVKAPSLPYRADGSAMSEKAVVALLERMVSSYGGRTKDHMNRPCISGHAMRLTGAQLLAVMGLDPIMIGMHGRWSSSAILSILAESPLLSVFARLKKQSQLAKPLQALADKVSSLMSKLPLRTSSSTDS